MSNTVYPLRIRVSPGARVVRAIGTLLWMLPIVLSAGSIHYALQADGARAQNLRLAMARILEPADGEAQAIGEPAAFARAAASTYRVSALNLPVNGEQRFPVAAEAWKSEGWPTTKIAMKADELRDMSVPAAPRAVRSARVSHEDTTATVRDAQASLDRKVTFRRVNVIGATALQADNLRIALADIEPLPEGATCKRLDGVVQDCAERAEHRLAVLLQAREITCQISAALENGMHLGRCNADKIDIASDLLRQKLAQRRLSTLAGNQL